MIVRCAYCDKRMLGVCYPSHLEHDCKPFAAGVPMLPRCNPEVPRGQ